MDSTISPEEALSPQTSSSSVQISRYSQVTVHNPLHQGCSYTEGMYPIFIEQLPPPPFPTSHNIAQTDTEIVSSDVQDVNRGRYVTTSQQSLQTLDHSLY